jgi:hypothetical protein
LLDISLTRIILALIKIKKNQVISLSFVESWLAADQQNAKSGDFTFTLLRSTIYFNIIFLIYIFFSNPI